MTFDEIERAVFEVIRKKIVSLGYLPDIALYQPTDDVAGYEAAKKAIRDSGKKIIDIKGVGDPKARGELDYNSIFINRGDIADGSLGFKCTNFYEKIVEGEETYFNVYENASGTVDIEYQIGYITDDVNYDRLIQSILFNSLRKKNYFKGINSLGNKTTEGFNTRYITTLDKSGKDYIERAARYDFMDIILEDRIFLYRTSQITDISIENVPTENI